MSILLFPFAMARLFVQSVALALGQIWANKMRSILTTMGIVIGVASVTAVIAAMTGLKNNVLAEFESLGTNKMFIYPDRPEYGPHKHATMQAIRFKPEHIQGMIEHCPSLAAITRVGSWTDRISSGLKVIEDVGIVGIEPSWHTIENRSVVLGRPFSYVDEVQAQQVCLLTPDLRDKLLLDRDCIGDTILVGNRTFQIVGLVEPLAQSSMFGNAGRRQEDVFIPFATAWKLREPFFHVVAISRSTELAEDARAEVRFFLRRTRYLNPGEPDTFQVEVIERYLQQFNTMAVTMTMVAAGIVGISLLVGGVGIMNIMLVSVSERTREIGLRKAVGARPSAILLQFLVEAVMLCMVGGGIGVLMGYLFTVMISNIPGANLGKAHIPLWAIGMSFGFAASVGVIFGMFPAIKAARLDPIEALRHE